MPVTPGIEAALMKFPIADLHNRPQGVRICPIADASPSARISKESTAALNGIAAQSVQVYGRPTGECPFAQ
jgi:hypothetical protein